MFRIRKEMKLVLIVFIILFSIYLGIKRSNLDKVFVQTDVKIDQSSANDIFENSYNYNKIKFEYLSEDLNEIRTLFTQINETEDLSIMYSDIKTNHVLVVLDIPVEATEALLPELRNVAGLSNENIQRSGIIMENTDLKENLNNNQIAKTRIQNLINQSVSPDRIQRFRNQLDIVQAKIDSLSIQKDIQKHNADYDIILLSAIKSTNGNSALRKSMQVFLVTSIASLLLLIIALLICYYIFVLMNKLMLVLGIRTTRGSSSNYNYNYNKKGYERKIKRIYKDKNGDVIKTDRTKE
jgi:hypothetical protein